MRWRVNFLLILCGPTDFSFLPMEELFFTAIEFEKEKEREGKKGRREIRMKNSYSCCEHTGAASSRVNERWFYFPSPGSGMKGRGKKGGGRETRGGGC